MCKFNEDRKEVVVLTKKKPKLTQKQKAFCDYYIKTLNITQSAISAGYSKKTAHSTGQENMKKPLIKDYIDARLEKLEQKRIMGVEEALRLFTSIARAEITEQVVTPSGKIIERLPDIKDRHKAAEELVKRFSLGNNQKLKDRLLEAQIKKAEAETTHIETGVTSIKVVNTWKE